jgi:peroxiredoxin
MRNAVRFLAVLGALSAAAVIAAPPTEPSAPAAPTAPAAGPKTAKLGEPAPAFTLKDSTGQERKLSDYKGKIVVLEWTSADCPVVQGCYKAKTMVNAFQQAKEMNKNVVWLAINTTYNTNAEKNNVWIKQHAIDFPILLDVDGVVGKLYDARKTPHMFVIDQQGILRFNGAIDNNDKGEATEPTNYVVNAIKQITAGETVAPDSVKPYGCSVKYKPASGH